MAEFKTYKFTAGELEVLMLVSKMKAVETPEGVKFVPRLFSVQDTSAYNHLKNQAIPILKKYSDNRLLVRESVKAKKFPEMLKLESERAKMSEEYEKTRDEKIMEPWDSLNERLASYEATLEVAMNGNEELLSLWNEEHEISLSEKAYSSLKDSLLSCTLPSDFPSLGLIDPLIKKFQ